MKVTSSTESATVGGRQVVGRDTEDVTDHAGVARVGDFSGL
jgi:hypothetical protein